MKKKKYTIFNMEIFLLKIKLSKIMKILRVVMRRAILSPVIKMVKKKIAKKKTIINREWAMPHKNTFSIKPIKELIERYLKGKWIDPFANDSIFKNQLITNDLNSEYNTDYNLDALVAGIGSDLTPSSANAGFINYYGNLRSSPRVIIKAGIVNPTLFDMELGDICTFSSMIPSTAFNKSFSGAYFMVTSLTRNSGKLQAQFIEVS